MLYRALVATTCTAVSLLLGVACDKPVEKAEETPAPAPAQAEASMSAQGRIDLQAIVAGVESGEVGSAAELETKLEADAVAHVDVDADGKRDELRIVEKRGPKATVFEVHAVPSTKVHADADSEIDFDMSAAPVVATLEFEARADAGEAVARASYSASFAASAKLDASATVEHVFTGVHVSAEGRMELAADANVFVAWAFRPSRPLYIAEVFVVVHAEPPPPDPCWPPGHCKHGFWKATGELPPGHEKRHDEVFADGHGKAHFDASAPGHAKADKPSHDGGGDHHAPKSASHHEPAKSTSHHGGGGGGGGKGGGGKGKGGKS